MPITDFRKMKKIELEELKTIQMDVLDVIHKFCIENDINYSLGCGTLLGAIRHKGYIPWDDDIDIYMLREEYERLIKLFPNIYSNISIVSLERCEAWEKPYAKAYDTRTFCDEDDFKIQIGVSIDIFPIDKVPQRDFYWKLFNNTRKFLHRLYESKYEPFSKNRKMYRNLILGICKIIASPFSAKRLCLVFDKYVQSFNAGQSEYVFESCQGMLQKNRFKYSNMESFIDLPFEDRVYKGMKEYDEYLRCGFGKYWELPPIEKRVSHHIIRAWWK